ncbi:response regulator transcription factor [Burkholderia ubonensis]|uniref:response regulator transcription factor n=1 Tax=Burkholderia ubonensis TaxID=101571 RepID=UPI00075539DB|nr:response regulator transcription factor [Burkholderia ubonensis]KVZ43641.1 hypothetical protein WL16_26195 [Burkholderia ubonensis]
MLSVTDQPSQLDDTLMHQRVQPLASRLTILDAHVERASMVKRFLTDALFSCQHYVSITEFERDQFHHTCDLIVLGDQIADMPCINALSQLRRSSGTQRVPVLMLGDPANHHPAIMIDSGADVFETWPVHAGILVARVYALLRRAYRIESSPICNAFGAYRFDERAQRIWIHNRLVKVAPKEFKLALLLFRHQSTILTVQTLSEWAWACPSMEEAQKHTVAVHISRIRRKLDLTGRHGYCLSFVPNHGYQLSKL